MDFNQTCIDILMGDENHRLDFDDLDSNFKVTGGQILLKMPCLYSISIRDQ